MKLATVQKGRKGTSVAIQWLRLCASNAEDTGSILGQGTKVPTCCVAKRLNKYFFFLKSNYDPSIFLFILFFSMWKGNREAVRSSMHKSDMGSRLSGPRRHTKMTPSKKSRKTQILVKKDRRCIINSFKGRIKASIGISEQNINIKILTLAK